MDDKNKFQEMLADILEVARVQGNRLSRKEIKVLFGDMELGELQYEHIFAYLTANDIKIEGYVESISEYTKVMDAEAETDTNIIEEDSIYLKMYLEDLEAIEEGSPEEEQELIIKILQGDSYAKNRFIEENLSYVVKIAGEYKNKGITLEDLIQEGNIGLINSLDYLAELSEKEKEKEFITNYVRRFIEDAISEQKNSINFESKMIEKIKFINEATNEMAEDMGREADIKELAAYTNLPVEEIQDILNMSADSVSVSKYDHENE